MIVYKYYPPTRYTKDALLKNYFFFNKVSKQNDPYDASFKLIQSPRYIDALLNKSMHPHAEQILKDYGTCSFAQRNDNKHMWAFYATNYEGVVIGYDEEYLMGLSQQFLANIPYVEVVYEDGLPDVDNDLAVFKPLYIQGDLKLTHAVKFCKAPCDAKTLEHLFVYLCSLKEKQTWGNEEERRLIAAGQIIRPTNQKRLKNKNIGYLPNGYTIPFPKESVKEIILGHNCSLAHKFIKRLIQKYKNAEIKQTICKTPFSIDIIPYNNKNLNN